MLNLNWNLNARKLTLGLFLALLAPSLLKASTYYISPSGNDSSGDGSLNNPWKTNTKAFSVGHGGDTFIYEDGTYNYSGMGFDGAIPSGSAQAYTILKAQNDGGAVISLSGALAMKDNSTPLQQYIQFEGLHFSGAYQKNIYGAFIKFLRCAFDGGPGSGNSVNTAVGGNNNGSNLANHVLLEDCWFWGSGGRYDLLVFNTEEVALRRLVIRHDGGWTYDNSNPEAGLAWYNSSTGTIQNVLLIDNNGTYSAGWSQAFYFIHNPSANPDHPSNYNTMRGILDINSKNLAFRADAINTTGNVMTDAAFIDGENGCGSFGANNNTSFTMDRIGCLRQNVTLSGDFKGGWGYWGTGGGIAATNLIVAGLTANPDFSGVSPTYFDTYGNGSTASGTGRQTYNPQTNGWKYPVRIESGSNLASNGTGGQMGPNIVNRWGTSGTFYGDAGYDSDSGQALWPWPNQDRIKSDLCANETRGFCSDTSLTHYVMNYFGNGDPYSSQQSTADTTAPTVSLTAPTNGASVSGSVSVTASASDNVGVSKVEFYLDGTLKQTDTASPYAYAWDSTLSTNGSHTLLAKAYDAAGNNASASILVTVSNVVPDTTAPTVTLTSPAQGATILGTSTATVSASDNVGVSKVLFSVDGVVLATDTVSPYSFAWNTLLYTNALHLLTATAYDAAGNSSSTAVSVTISNILPDVTPPTISLTAPTNGSTVSGSVSVTASALDNVGVSKVEFYLDGALKQTDNASPYAYTWDSTLSTNGSHTLLAKAYDAAGNNTSASISVTVSNAVPDTTAPAISLTSPLPNATVSGTVAAAAAASDNVGVTQVVFSLDGVVVATDTASPYTYSWNTTLNANASHALSATAYDAAGNSSSTAVTVSVSNILPDVTPPTVSLTAPTNGSTVSGSVSVTASASDNVGVTKVEFYLDGTLQQTDTAGPYAYTWDSTLSTNGSHTLLAKAYDAAGNNTSASVSVTASNGSSDNTPPTVAITAPANGATVWRTVTVSASASDNVGVSKVEFYVDGNLRVTDNASPYTYAWNASYESKGSHTLTAKAYDAAGNSAAASVAVWVARIRLRTASALTTTNGAPALAGFSSDGNAAILSMTSDESPLSGPSASLTIHLSSGDRNVTLTQAPGDGSVYYAVIGSSVVALSDLASLSEVSVTVGTQTFTVEIQNGVIVPSIGGRVIESSGRATVQLMPGAITDEAQLQILQEPPATLSVRNAALSRQGFLSLGAAREIVMTTSGTLKSATIVFPFDRSLLPPGATLAQARIAYFNPATGNWELQQNTTLAGESLQCDVTHFSLYKPVFVLQNGGALQAVETFAYPNPAVGSVDPTLRVVMANADSIELDILDLTGRVLRRATLTGAPSGYANGQPYYDYVWDGPKASGVYFALARGKSASGTAGVRTKFAVIR